MFHLHRRCKQEVLALRSLCLYLDTPPLRHLSFRMAQDILWPNPFPYKYPNTLIPVILPAYTAYGDGTECFETSTHKIQTPAGYQPK